MFSVIALYQHSFAAKPSSFQCASISFFMVSSTKSACGTILSSASHCWSLPVGVKSVYVTVTVSIKNSSNRLNSSYTFQTSVSLANNKEKKLSRCASTTPGASSPAIHSQ